LTGAIAHPTAIQSSAAVNNLAFTYTASAVNYITVGNNTTGNSPYLLSTGSDSAIGLNLVTKNGPVAIVDNTATAAPAFRWTNAADSHFFGLKSADAASGPDVDFILPSADGSGNSALWSNGSHVLSFGTFANANITSMTGLTGVLKAPTGIQSSSSLNLLTFNYVASAVNYMQVNNAATGGYPGFYAEGSDSTVGLNFQTKGSYIFINDSTTTIAVPIRFYNAAGTNYTALSAQTSAASSVSFQLPAADGSAGQALITNGSGVLSFGNAIVTNPTIQTFTSGSAATYTTPANVKYIRVQCVGGGGGGGFGGNSGHGGGSGATCISIITSPAATYTYTVGASAAGATGAGNLATAGNATTFSAGTMSAGGGGAAGGFGAGGHNVVGAGGTASGGNIINIPGYPGLFGALMADGSTVTSGTGGGAGGGASRNTAGVGNSGVTNSGGGGGGAIGTNSNNGGAGAAGYIVVEEYYG